MENFTPLEKEVLDTMLDKLGEPYITIRQQLSKAVVSKREITGVGFFTHFFIPAGLLIRYDLPDMTIGDVGAEITNLKHGAGFVLFIRKGRVEMLEGYTYDELWPIKIDQFKILKLPPMNTQGIFNINLENAKRVANCVYSGLFCPKCKKQSVEVFFTEHNLKKGYGIWFECQLCGNVEHISCGSKPEGFTPLRISEKFQIIDERAWETEK